ncbi:MAG: LamG domain-containing protein, partial [Nitrosopumilales archaeon]|nr:LamG domain-containing protein [Nitrosopumilales archaeon]
PTNATLIPTNSTQYEEPVEIPTNATLIPTNSTQVDGPIVITNTTRSWQFNDLDNEEIILVGNATIQEGQGFNATSLQLDGQSDYAKIKDNSTRDLTEFSLSAWIKPDYSGGSPEFTVISKSEAFSLSINNTLAPEKFARFAVFNGMKWTAVGSHVEIMDGKWTYLTATFNGTTIAIYVNGTLQSAQKIDDLPFISVGGLIETKTVSEITSESDIVIGAYISDLRRGDPKILSKFSGLLDDVRFYDSLLGDEQILELYQLGKVELDNTVSTIPAESEINEPVVDLNEINFTSNVSTTNENQSNSTATENNKILVSLTGLEELKEFIAVNEELLNQDLDQLTISAWIMPNYTATGSAEYTIVAKERSFILSLNNIIPPEKVGVFSVFDGISWSTSTGETKIPEQQWSHLAAVIDKKDIRLYINGELEGSSSLYQPYIVNSNEIYNSNEQVAETDAKIMIGVYIDNARDTDSISKRFIGSIDDVLIYKQALTSDEIKNIVLARMPTLFPTNATLIPTNATLIPTNATLIPTNATLIPTNAT